MILDYDLIDKIIYNHKFKFISINHDYSSKKFLSKRRRNHVKKCIEQACRSSMRCKHGSVAVLNDEIVAEGCNVMENDSDDATHFSLHAEVNAIQQCKKKKLNTKEIDIYVVRLKTRNRKIVGLYNSDPCLNCFRMMAIKYSFRNVISS